MEILVVQASMGIGGIEVSLVNFLSYLTNNHRDLKIDLYLDSPSGPLMAKIPSSVNILNDSSVQAKSKDTDKPKLVKTNFIKKVKHWVFNHNILNIQNKIYQRKYKSLKLEKFYDVVICFHGFSTPVVIIGTNCVKAKQKWALLHSDFNNVNIPRQKQRMLQSFDKILCVSQSCAKILKDRYKKLASKVDFMYNIQPIEEIINKSCDFEVKYQSGVTNIVSVSRLSKEKGLLRSLAVFNKLAKEGLQFCWHIVGDGDCRPLIENYIKENNLGDYVKLYGRQENPYPYIKAADILYLGSYHEAAPMVYAEAMSLKVPVLTTKTSSAEELVGEYGFVCDNNLKDIYVELKRILTYTEILQDKIRILDSYKYDNESIAKKIYTWGNN